MALDSFRVAPVRRIVVRILRAPNDRHVVDGSVERVLDLESEPVRVSLGYFHLQLVEDRVGAGRQEIDGRPGLVRPPRLNRIARLHARFVHQPVVPRQMAGLVTDIRNRGLPDWRSLSRSTLRFHCCEREFFRSWSTAVITGLEAMAPVPPNGRARVRDGVGPGSAT